ncbi:hypothetical protein BD324DRAFT_346657 [Kockovaella imperatae]|uniref:N-acetyltransferase domain-containing protein n=1 Tax=Kockovaella imperatae TaxID=4999 RepID=A0A1Y1UJP9_9TREE|nr:hypothetical protein BD324DRAFT_346657 [Kockovaella imperatae]ORX38278.1 hypothetical protein BD324DRAFT_346657 [Kockovaella imperatae]
MSDAMQKKVGQVRLVTEYTDKIFDSCVTVLEEGFAKHPLTAASHGGDPELLHLETLHLVALAFTKWAIFACGDDEEEISSVMLVNPSAVHPIPGCAASSSEPEMAKNAKLYEEQYEAKLPQHLKDWRDHVFETVLTQCRSASAGDAEPPHRINLIASKPSARGKGHGSALKRHLLRIAREQDASVSLNCQEEATHRWYSSLGFVTRYHTTFETPDHETMSLWSMLWQKAE